jgi:hypothetical protein
MRQSENKGTEDSVIGHVTLVNLTLIAAYRRLNRKATVLVREVGFDNSSHPPLCVCDQEKWPSSRTLPLKDVLAICFSL